jgi:hypothetical protein
MGNRGRLSLLGTCGVILYDYAHDRVEKLHLDCASSAPSHHGSTQQWALLHRKDYLQGFLQAGSCRLRPPPARGPEQP